MQRSQRARFHVTHIWFPRVWIGNKESTVGIPCVGTNLLTGKCYASIRDSKYTSQVTCNYEEVQSANSWHDRDEKIGPEERRPVRT